MHTNTLQQEAHRNHIHFDKGYLIAGGIPALLFLITKGLYTLSFGSPLPTLMPYPSLPFVILAAISFYYLLQHSSIIQSKNPWMIYIFSSSYGFCSYAILQENTILPLLLYAIFPIIFYHYENMVLGKKYIPFAIACAVMLIIHPEAGIEISLLLFVFALLLLVYLHKFNLGEIVHTFLIFLFAYGLGAARIIFYLAPYFAEHSDYSYEGFSLAYHPAILLGRFLPGVAASRALSGSTDRMDLYFGILPLIFFFLFFFQKEIRLRLKGIVCIFTLLILSMLEFSPVLYVFNLFHITYHTTLTASFFLVFWMLYVGAYAANKSFLPDTTNLIAYPVLCGFIPVIISFIWGKHNFHSNLFVIYIILFAIYTLLLFIRRTAARRIIPILFFVMIIELFSNAYICTNKNYVSKDFSLEPHLAYSIEKALDAHSSTGTAKTQTKQNDYSKKYTDYVNNHKKTSVQSTLYNALSTVSLSDKEAKKYCSTIFPDFFQQANGICKKAGIDGTLFTKCAYTLHFSNTKEYQVDSEGYGIYNISAAQDDPLSGKNINVSNGIIPYTIQMSTKAQESVYLLDNTSRELLLLDDKLISGKSDNYLKVSTSLDRTINVQILLYEMNDNVYKKLCDYIDNLPLDEDSASTGSSYLAYDYAGIILSVIFVMILIILCLYDGKDKLFHSMYKCKDKMCHNTYFQSLTSSLKAKRIYWLSFLIPFLLYILAMVINDAQPFGSNSLFDSDGTWSSIPAFLDHYYKYQSGNRYLSMNIGYGSDLSLSYTIHLLSKLYHFLPLKMIVPALQFFIAFFLGFCGLSMTCYLTHRLSQPAANNCDFRLLFPSAVYSLSAYNLAVHCYPTWYIILALFPLVMLSMDYLIIQKKWILYSALLGVAILLEIQLAMFICIYLVIRFFAYQWKSIKDFICSGLRFTASSLLAGGCGFMTIYRTLTSYQSSGYTDADSIFPSLGFHGSFWEQWRKLFLFTPTDAVSSNDGNVSLYCGILTLICVCVYFIYTKATLISKLRRLIPLVILLISFNGQVLSYLWNGLHYQSNCPNRYVFILIFLLAELSYDGFIHITKLNHRQFQHIFIGIFVFFIACYSLASEKIVVAFISSLCVLIASVLLYFHYNKNSFCTGQKLYYFLTLFALLEISGNAIYATSTWDITSIATPGNYSKISQTLNGSIMRKDGEYFRIGFIGDYSTNLGQYYNIGCLNSFGTCLNREQIHMHTNYGFHQTSNAMGSDYSSTPLNTSLIGCKYLFLPSISVHSVLDLEQYNYLGFWQGYYVFENPSYTALGIYMPDSVIDAKLNQDFNPKYYNQAMSLYMNNASDIYDFDVLSYTAKPGQKNSFYYTDSKGNIISRTKAKKIIVDLPQGIFYSSRIKLHINYTAEKTGSYYLYATDLASLGTLIQGNNSVTIGLPYQVLLDNDKVNILRYHADTANKALQKVRANQMTNISIKNDAINGTTNYTNDGYTLFSLGYSKNWHAYIDGKEVEILNPYNSNLMIKTPAGKHTVTLKFVPYKLKICQYITLGFWILCGIVCLLEYVMSRHLLNRKSRK